jgi:ceramide glucosyltransferase
MTIVIWALATYSIVATATHLGSILIATSKCRKPRSVSRPAESQTALGLLGLTRYLRRTGRRATRARDCTDAPSDAAGVSLVRPVCGMENYIEETLRSAFHLDYPRYEIVFCAASAHDAAVPLVRRLIAAHPHVATRLLIGNETISDNPKLNNVCKGWRAAAYDWIVMADSNVLMPRDYIERLLAAWRADTGVVSSPPAGGRPQGFWAELECAFLNTYQLRWQYTSAAIGLGFAQGKSMLYRRSQIDAPFEQPLGYRSAGEVWARQLRWAKLRQASFRQYYALEILSGSLGPLTAAACVVAALGLPLGSVVALAVIWYGAEAALARAAGWHLSLKSPAAWMLRDALLPLLWIGGWLGRGFVWRGNEMRPLESRGAV